MPPEPILVNAALGGMGLLLVGALVLLLGLRDKVIKLYTTVIDPEIGVVAVLKEFREEVREEFKGVKTRVSALERRRG